MSEEAIRRAVQQALSGMGVEDVDVRLDQPRDPSHGDLATTVALTLADTLRQPPRVIAEEIDEYVGQLLDAGANVLGGCCGMGPAHIKRMAALSEAWRKRRSG